jgi:general secretion pathway protein G
MGTKNNNTHGSKIKALTLIELLVVVSVIALLALLAINVFFRQIYKSNDSRRKADLKRIGVAAEEYEKDHNCYPTEIECGEESGQEVYPYLRNVPCDPVTHLKYEYEPGPPASCPSWYRLYTKLQNEADPQIILSIGPGGLYNFYSSSANAPSLVGSSPAPTPDSGGSSSGYWGCINRVCVSIDVTAPGEPVCNPSYTSPDCNNDCNDPQNRFDCIPIN